MLIKSRNSVGHLLRPGRPKNTTTVRASYDSAATTSHNERHWRFSDDLSPDESARPEVRRVLRNRSRYEILRNSSIGSGMIQMLANDTVGSAVKLVMGLENESHNRAIQSGINDWLEAIDFVENLRAAKIDKTISGETLFRIVKNVSLDSEVKLDLLGLEADHLCSPLAHDDHRPHYVDGVHLDHHKKPVAYDILREHPGSWFGQSSWRYETWSKYQVIHWYRKDRPGQHRGVSEVCSALPLFAHRRRFQLATIAAAETAANRATVIETDLEPQEMSQEVATALEKFLDQQALGTIPLDRNEATVLPAGTKLTSQSPHHPASSYEMFDRAIIMELSRCVLMPYETISGNHAGLSFSGGRLSRANYERAVHVERSFIRRKILDRLFSEWMYEAALIDLLPSSITETVLDIVHRVGVGAVAHRIPHAWHFDGFQEADASKAANAARTRLQSGLSDRASEYAKAGIDVDEADLLAAKHYGMSVAEYRRRVADAIFSNGNASSGSLEEVIDQLKELDQSTVAETLGLGV